ncbi:MAG: DUF4387 domain-containing protein [Rhodospirillaceae bacterium]
MPELGSLAKLIRSKNAGPFVLTYDIMFEDEETYRRVVRSGVLNRALVSELFNVSENEIQFFEHDLARAIKFSIPRPYIQGQVEDGDTMGGQQFAPLVTLEIP